MIALSVALLGGCEAASADGAGAEVARAEAAAEISAIAAEAPVVMVYKSPSCQCCGEWVDHLNEHGFRTEVAEMDDVRPVKVANGVPASLSSCHTSMVGDYVLEGHVPADVLAQLLKDRPDIQGLAVPGMPPGVPGMPEAGPDRALYEIVSLHHDGSTKVYATR